MMETHAIQNPTTGIHDVEIVCDRCHAVIDGMRGEFATAGFYDVTGESWWARFAKPGEANVCDACMWADDEYRAMYGVRA